jgi:hypothetical protein
MASDSSNIRKSESNFFRERVSERQSENQCEIMNDMIELNVFHQMMLTESIFQNLQEYLIYPIRATPGRFC